MSEFHILCLSSTWVFDRSKASTTGINNPHCLRSWSICFYRIDWCLSYRMRCTNEAPQVICFIQYLRRHNKGSYSMCLCLSVLLNYKPVTLGEIVAKISEVIQNHQQPSVSMINHDSNSHKTYFSSYIALNNWLTYHIIQLIDWNETLVYSDSIKLQLSYNETCSTSAKQGLI